MPIAGQTPEETMHTEMKKFKEGTLHSGSSSGPKVESRKQAIAIGLSEARKAAGSKSRGLQHLVNSRKKA